MKIKLYLENYKGKFDILTDNEVSDWNEEGNEAFELDTETFEWANHCLLAEYYGVPAYIGINKTILKKIEEYETDQRAEELS